jgi:hypothetical protein
MDKIDNKLEENNRLLNEILWSQVFNSSKSACKWLGDEVALWPGRWGVGYQYMYVVSRLLNEVQPKSILETGLGQSTRLIASYVKWISGKQECHHLVLEHDSNWIEIFKNDFQVSESTKIVQRNLERLKYQMENGNYGYTCAYQGMEEVMAGRKFDFISIDAPYGVDDKNGLSRFDIINYVPDCLEHSFCIVLDDYNRWGEKNTIGLLKSKLNESHIDFCETVYRGNQDMYLIASKDLKFLCTL